MNQARYLVFLTTLLVLAAPVWEARAAVRCEGLFRETSHLDFHERRDLSVTTMKPSLVKNRGATSIDSFLQTLDVVGAAVRDLAPSKEVTSAVLYPMSGFDLTTPLRLFPDAETIMLVDNHTLMRANEVEDVSRRAVETDARDRNGSWIRYDQTGGDVFTKLMTSLFATLPAAKIKSIEFITDELNQVSAKIVVSDTARRQTKTIFYLTGEIGNVNIEAQMAAYRNGSNPQSHLPTFQGNWWDDLVGELAPQTLLLKGSMSALRQTAHEKQLRGRERILRPLLENGGLIVEGASNLTVIQDAEWAKKLKPQRDRWELTDGDPRLQKAKRERVVRGVQFSYSNNVRIAVYDPK